MRIAELVDAGLAEIRTGPFGTQLHAADYVSAGRPVLNVRNVGFGEVRAEKLEFVDEATAMRLSGHILRKGDIVFGRKGAVERHAFIQEPFVGAVQGSDCIRLRIFDGAPIRPAFATFALRTREHQSWMHSFCSHGATMASLNQDILRQIVLPDLDLRSQESVIEVLGAIDDLIAINRRRTGLLEQMAEAIYREWFVRFRYPGHEDDTVVGSPLGPIPEGWEVHQLKELSSLVRGRSYRKYELVGTGGVPFINLKCMRRGGGFRRDGLKRYDGIYNNDQRVGMGDIVLAVTDLTQEREILARATLVPRLTEEFGVISLDVARIVPDDTEDRLPLFFALRCTDFPDRVKEHANGSTVLHLSPTHVAEGQIVWPAQALRRRFVQIVEAMIEQVDDLNDAGDRLARIRDLLLPRLVTGQIDVTNLDFDALVDSVA